MANIKANIKSIVTNEKRRLRNNAIKSRVKTATKKAIKAINQKDENALELVRLAHSEIANARSKNVLHANNAARKSSRLDAKYNAAFQK
ncbi:30S ribosomal protein S20 [Mycoplasmopsis agassizii]|uniref:Small ribosomal subunit protein bS20 n=1 Tax=Mycoplasmopsis agassizii TaxID=33922 RepID=A0A1W1WVF3_9BACT|nr:30S ribosomal protein S20 [Mycoplasmopsis agassizii]PAF55288.1 30S ribosomal protein S20 [Mycoplasmopsis agassizii]PAK20957.1 30S ribosomal protein S20 [Mycoplasmopsis agassizii]SMC15706.1 small subunit ribosomal protein S20 [Mycoplasmopsis agassizii]